MRGSRFVPKGDLRLYGRLLGQVGGAWPLIAGIFLISLLSTPLSLLTPLPLKIAVDSAIGTLPLPPLPAWLMPEPGSRGGALTLAALLLIALAVLKQLQGIASSLLQAYTSEKLVLNFRSRVFGHVQRLSLAYHDTIGTSDSTYRIQYDAQSIQYVPLDGLIPFVTSATTLVGMLWVTLRIDWQLALVALTVAPLLYIASTSSRGRFRNQSREVKQLESLAMNVVQEALSAIRVVKAFGREDHEERRYRDHSARGMRARIHLGLTGGAFDLSVGLITAVGTAATLWIGVQHVMAGSLTTGGLLLVMSYLGQLYDPLRTIGKKVASLQGYLSSAERVFSILDRAPDVIERADARPLRRAAGAVTFQDVCFSYQEGQPVLHDISFDVPFAARVGIVGRTGAGKTTILSLLTRFYDPDSGQILLDGVDLRDYKVADLRSQFAIVLQEPVLFSTTIAENIAYARPEASPEEIIRAAELADAHDFIARLPDGYETSVGERGMRLSGGERQRISLARAFLKDAPILLLDEPTSSVDLKTESTIIDAMERLMRGRTTFIVAHRLSTLRDCDIRLEIEDGHLVSQRLEPGDTLVGAGLVQAV